MKSALLFGAGWGYVVWQSAAVGFSMIRVLAAADGRSRGFFIVEVRHTAGPLAFVAFRFASLMFEFPIEFLQVAF